MPSSCRFSADLSTEAKPGLAPTNTCSLESAARRLPTHAPRRSMHRYATAPRSTFEELFEQARSGTFKLDAADYPPVCGGRSGEVSLALGRTGAMIVHVEPGECRADEFRLKLLFETGTCVFSTPARAVELLDRAASPRRSGSSRRWQRSPRRSRSAGVTTARCRRSADTDASRPTLASTAVQPRRTAASQRQPDAAALTAASLAAELARVIHGQDAALERVASATVAQLTQAPSGPAGLGGPARPDRCRQDGDGRGASGRAEGARLRRTPGSSGSTAAS